MSIADKITALNNAKTQISSAITAKGGTVASGDGFSDFAAAIRNIPSGGGGVDYSYNEQNTGLKWFDGKDIYQKTFRFSYNNSSPYTTDLISSEIDRIVYFEGVVINGTSVYAIDNYGIGGYFCIDAFAFTGTNLRITYMKSGLGGDVYITVRYTKKDE